VPILNRLDEQIGRVELYYDSATGRNCAMVRSNLGRAVSMSVRLEVQNGPSQYASGRWTYYSDGAALYAPGKCVRFSGSINGGTTDNGSASRGFGNCG